jgi:WXG100 family type VII secretion target
MGSDAIRVETEALSQAAQAVARSADRFAESLDVVDRIVRGLAVEWSGTASDGFQQAVARWRSASSDLHRSLGQLKTLLSQAHGNYVAADDAGVTMWGRR